MNNRLQKARRTVKPLLFGCATGIIGGAIITLFIICAKVVSHFTFELYESARTPLFVVCICMLVLLCCLITAVIQTLCPTSKGSGIPLAEGCARGMLRVKWLRNAAALIAGSLIAFLSGMPLGSEGPSIGVGGLIGDGVGKSCKQPVELRRYLITGGASAGLAVAFNAPLTGVAFALEETHRRFSPGILVAAFSAVVPAVLISQLLFWAFGHNAYLNGLGIESGFTVMPALKQAEFTSIGVFMAVCGIAAVCGIICSLFAISFNHIIFALGKVFGKIKSPMIRLLPAFALAALCGLLMHQTVGSGEATLHSVSIRSAVWMIVVLFLLRFILTSIASGSGATGGLFLPMIALGGLIGTLLAKAACACSLSEAYASNIIMLCIAAFFAASVRAPISAMAMTIELTASFSNLLPCAIAVGISTAVAGLCRTAPLYERMMENMQAATPVPAGHKNLTVCGRITERSVACGKRIRDILWPYNCLVTGLERTGEELVPDGETVLMDGDVLTVRAERVDPSSFREQIDDYIVPSFSCEGLGNITKLKE